MAILALGLVGAGIGGTFGYAALGWAIGTTLGRIFFSPSDPNVTQYGPRLGDLSVTSSAYGQMINIAYGTVRVNGNVIWSSGIYEETFEESQSTGKGSTFSGGQTVSQVTYAYFASFAIGLCEGVVDDVLRIWADGKLVFDKTGAGDDTTKTGLSFRFYPGSETQTADSLIAANVGSANCPAHRGLCYIVIERLPLADYGNRIPNFTVEVTRNVSDSQPVTSLTHLTGGTGYEFMLPDWTRGTMYQSIRGTPSKLVRSTLSPFAQESVVENTDYTYLDLVAILPLSGNLVISTGVTNSVPIALFDPTSLTALSEWGGSAGLNMSPTQFELLVPERCCAFASDTEEYVLGLSIFNSVGILKATGGTLTYLWDTDTAIGGLTESQTYGSVQGLPTATNEAVAHFFVGNSAAMSFYTVTVKDGAQYDGTSATSGVNLALVASYVPSDFISGGSIFNGFAAGWLDEADGNIIVQAYQSSTEVTLAKLDVSDGSIIWATALGLYWHNSEGLSHSRITNSRLALIENDEIIVYDTRDGSLISDTTGWSDGGPAGGLIRFYDDERGILIAETSNETSVKKYQLYRASGGGELLSAVITDLCTRTTLTAADVDVADQLTKTVRGYVVSRQSTIRNCLEQLTVGFFFDAVESDYTLKFPDMDASAVVDIAQADLADIDDNGNYWQLTRNQDADLPRRLSVGYMDYDLDYQPGLQQTRRVSLPDPTMWAGSEQRLDLPIVFIGDEAKGIAERNLYNTWVGREHYKGRLGWKHILLDPADVFNLTLNDGTTYKARIARLENVLDSLAVDIDTVAENPAAYSSSLTADSGQGVPTQKVAALDTTKGWVLDIPLLRDQDVAPTSFSRFYHTVSHYNASATWPGAFIYRSDGSGIDSYRTQIISPAAWGVAVNALGDTSSPFSPDRTNTLTVSMRIGGSTLESVTDAELVAGDVNAALVGDEIIKFRDVTQNSDGTYTLSRLLRGRRGTDTETGSHTAGERFIILKPGTMAADSIPQSEIGTSYTYTEATIGGSILKGDKNTIALTGADLKPYAPVHAARTDTASTIVFSWVRQTRIGGQLRSYYSTTPLSETIESYAVDIYLSAGAASAIRTLTSSTTTATYTSAQIATDFGSVPSRGTLNIKVFQLSGEVGRGSSYSWSV